ncbi:MAG: YciI family protein [Gemmobacter sp.]
MQFTILCYETAADFARRTDPVESGPYWAGWSAYGATLAQAGVFVSGAGLLPPAMAATVRTGGGGRTVQDGPFAEVREQLGGFFVIEVPNMEAALDWAARAPSSATASTEVRPVLVMPG